MISIQQKDFDVGAEYGRLRRAAGDAGAIVTFTGLVREIYNHDEVAEEQDRITGLYLEHYAGMTEKSLQAIVDEANTRWRLSATRIIHRVGELGPGDQIVLVATAGAHRQDAFDAAQFIMDYLKSNAPFWKKQRVGGDSEWIQSRQSDTEAVARWQESGES